MKKLLLIFVLVLALGLAGLFAARFFIAGDEDTWICTNGEWVKHGNPANPAPQTGCGENRSEIQNILAQKYNKPASEVKITILKQDENYAGGSVLFDQGGPGEGGMFLARKVADAWEVVFDGNGNVDCNKMRQEYSFPDTILIPNFCE